MSFGNYENIEMTAEVENGETVKEALGKLEETMGSIIQEKDQFHRSYRQINAYLSETKDQLAQLDSEIIQKKEVLNRINEWLKKHNINVDVKYDLPF